MAILATPLLISMTIATAQTQIQSEQIEWDLAELYTNEEVWTAEKERLDAQVEQITNYRGRLGENALVLREALDLISAIEKELSQLHVYAFLKADEDRRIAVHQERRSLAAVLRSDFEEAISFVSPELLRIGSATVEAYIAEEPGLTKHAFNLRNILRREPHTLSEETERVIASTGPIVDGPERIYAMLSSSDLPFPKVTLSTGDEIRLDHSAYTLHRASQNRQDRQLVFDAFWGTWKKYETTLGQVLDTHIKTHVFEARARRYGSSLEAALAEPNIPTDVYSTLLEAAHRHLPSLHRYLKLRQRMLGLGDLHYYDIYPSLVVSNRNFNLDESKQLALEAAVPLGSHYINLLKQGFAGRWMHVYPQQGKAPGAYMHGGAYDVHPFLLLNYNHQWNDVSTFTHEWGHAIHTMLSKEHNPWETSGYATFTAEIASITNEVLLQEFMLSQEISDDERLYYLGEALEAIRGTFFRQVMFAEFELKIHELIEAGEALSGEKMTVLYEQLLRQYHGADDEVMQIKPEYAVEWAFIPHFYRNFYVFQYATSIAGGTMFAQRLLANDASAQNDYLAVLSSGGSRFAYELLREYGVDLATNEPYDILIARMNQVMNQIEQILDRRGQ